MKIKADQPIFDNNEPGLPTLDVETPHDVDLGPFGIDTQEVDAPDTLFGKDRIERYNPPPDDSVISTRPRSRPEHPLPVTGRQISERQLTPRPSV